MIVLLLIFAAISCFFLGTIVLLQNSKQLTNQLFAGICACFTVWAISILCFLMTSDAATALISAKVFYVAAAIFAGLLLIFASIFPRDDTLSMWTKILIGLVSVAMVAAILIDSHFITGEVVIINGVANSIIVDKPSYILYSIYFVSLFSVGIFIAFKKFLRSRGKERMQSGLYALGILINSIPGIITNLLLPYYGIYDYVWVGPVASAFFLGFATYGIIRHSLFDIRLAAVRSAAYVMALLTLSGIYYFLAYVVSLTVFKGEVSTTVSLSPINVFLALVLAFTFQPIKTFFDKVTNNIFYHDRYNSDEFFARLSEVLTTTTDLRNLLVRASDEIGTTLKAEQTFFFVQYNHVHHVSAGTKRHASLPVTDAHRLNEYVKKNGADVVVADLLPDDHTIQRMLISHKIAVLMPLMRGNTILGYLALGEQRSTGYTNRDIKVLKTISDELVIAVQNSLSVEEVKDINIHLQQRIDAATAELRTSNTQLRHLDKTKDEFLSMASHQLRTPLTSVKGYLSMVLEGDAGKVSAMQKQLLGEAFTSSERMVHLIHDFLNVSRLQTGKFMLELHPYDIAKLVDEEVRSLQRAAEVRNMKLDFVNNIGELMMRIDENKIRQVVMNFIDNALYYSHPDSTITIRLSRTDDDIELRVIDTGIGVPKGEQAQLFSKFYRASNARKQRPDGTGVGIFLAKKVVTEHGGDVLFESVEGKGSTFGFTLPVKKLSLDKESDDLNDENNHDSTNPTANR